MERREDPEDRKQVVREVLTEKVTLEQRPKEEDEGACRVLGAPSKGPEPRPPGEREEASAAAVQRDGKRGRRVRRDSGGLADHSEDLDLTWGDTGSHWKVLSKAENHLACCKVCCRGRGRAQDTHQRAVVIIQVREEAARTGAMTATRGQVPKSGSKTRHVSK